MREDDLPPLCIILYLAQDLRYDSVQAQSLSLFPGSAKLIWRNCRFTFRTPHLDISFDIGHLDRGMRVVLNQAQPAGRLRRVTPENPHPRCRDEHEKPGMRQGIREPSCHL